MAMAKRSYDGNMLSALAVWVKHQSKESAEDIRAEASEASLRAEREKDGGKLREGTDFAPASI